MQQAQKYLGEDGGFAITIPAVIRSLDLQQAIETRSLGSNYSVQMRRDLYRITLPNLSIAQCNHLFAMS